MWAAGGKSYSCVNRLLTNFLPIFTTPKTTTDWNPSLSSTSVVVYRCALPSPSMQGHTMQLHHWAIAGWGLVARTRRLRGNRLHYWMVAMNRELRYCNNWSGQRLPGLAWGDGNVDRCTQCHQARFNLKFRQRGNIAIIAKAANHKLPGKSSFNVSFVLSCPASVCWTFIAVKTENLLLPGKGVKKV